MLTRKMRLILEEVFLISIYARDSWIGHLAP